MMQYDTVRYNAMTSDVYADRYRCGKSHLQQLRIALTYASSWLKLVHCQMDGLAGQNRRLQAIQQEQSSTRDNPRGTTNTTTLPNLCMGGRR